MRHQLNELLCEDKLNLQFGSMLDIQQAKRREIVRTIIRFAEKCELAINWIATIRYILIGDGSQPIISKQLPKGN